MRVVLCLALAAVRGGEPPTVPAGPRVVGGAAAGDRSQPRASTQRVRALDRRRRPASDLGHRVVDGTDYPATMFAVFDNDTRTDPMHGRKMCAAVQSATPREGVTR